MFFESNPKMFLCGVVLVNGEPSPVYWDEDTGALVYQDSTDGSVMAIGEVSFSFATQLIDETPYAEMLMAGQCADAYGLVFKDENYVLALMTEYEAEVRTVRTLTEHSSETIEIDMNVVSEINDDF